MPYAITITPANVRRAIGIDIEAAMLSDTDIAFYASPAIIEVKNKDPKWAERDTDDQAHLNLAAEYLTASRAVYAVPAIKSVKFIMNEGFDREPMDPDKVSARLVDWAEAEIQIVVTQGAQADTDFRPTMFGLACGRRGL